MNKISGEITEVAIDELLPADYNPRKLSDTQHEEIKKSLETFGFVTPAVINKNPDRKNIIVGGHQRIKVWKNMGETIVPCVFVDLPLAQEKELNVRLNKNTGQFDYDLLANFDEEMLLNIGFNPDELDHIFDLKEGKGKPDEVPETKEEVNIKLGDMYKLGDHRLLCGDSTKMEDVDRLMDGQKARMIFTDPPYNVNYSGTGKDTSEGIENDNLTPEEFTIFIEKVFDNLHKALQEGAVYYICSGWTSYPVFNKILQDLGFYRAGVIIWVKNNAAMGWNDFRYKHEWIAVGKTKPKRVKAESMMYGWKEGPHYFRDTRAEYDVWEVPRAHSATMVHPTQKPVWLVSKALADSSQRGDIVLDLFGGSGSTIISCDRMGRKCYGDGV